MIRTIVKVHFIISQKSSVFLYTAKKVYTCKKSLYGLKGERNENLHQFDGFCEIQSFVDLEFDVKTHISTVSSN